MHIDDQALRSSLQRLRQAAFEADVVAVMKRAVNAVDRAAYYVYDNYLNNAVGARLAALYRRTLKRSPAPAA